MCLHTLCLTVLFSDFGKRRCRLLRWGKIPSLFRLCFTLTHLNKITFVLIRWRPKVSVCIVYGVQAQRLDVSAVGSYCVCFEAQVEERLSCVWIWVSRIDIKSGIRCKRFRRMILLLQITQRSRYLLKSYWRPRLKSKIKIINKRICLINCVGHLQVYW